MLRRTFLKGAILIGSVAGFSKPAWSLMDSAQTDVFTAQTEKEVLGLLFGTAMAVPSKAIKIDAPVQVMKDGAIQFSVVCDMDEVSTIAILTANNRHPLNTYLRLSGADGYYSTRIRIEQTSTVTAYVKAGGELYSSFVYIKVSQGGYGTQF